MRFELSDLVKHMKKFCKIDIQSLYWQSWVRFGPVLRRARQPGPETADGDEREAADQHAHQGSQQDPQGHRAGNEFSC